MSTAVRAREIFDVRTYEDRDWAARLELHRLAKTYQHPCVDPIGLSQKPGSLGEAA